MVRDVDSPFFRFRVVIAPDAPIDLHPHQAGLIYAVLAAAYGQATGRDDLLPDGLMLDAPEQCRVRVGPGEPFAFGFTLLRESAAEAAATLRPLLGGLKHIATHRPKRRAVLGGNFRVVEVQDLVAGRAWKEGALPTPIPRAMIEEEAERAADLETLTLRFRSPFRMTRPKGDRQRPVEYFDGGYFHSGAFCVRVVRRLHELGLVSATLPSGGEPLLPALVISPEDRSLYTAAEVIENRLVWLDLAYGPRHADSRCFGAVGRVQLRIARRDVRRALAWAQYARLGQATRFGQGGFRIEELGPDPFSCERAISLADCCLRHFDLDDAAQRYELPAGTLRRAAKELSAGRYAPKDVFRVPIVQPDGRERTLAIPARLDRGLQRSVIGTLAPGLDRLFEESAVAYRRGLGRETAARRIRDAYAAGFRYGLRADFRRFFDSIDHRVLRERLEAYVNDDSMTNLLMRWVSAGAPAPGLGIPTGAPISPLIANLFLDRFDEEMQREGARLIRYADDFVVLYRTKEEADAVFAKATESARALELELNSKKTHEFGPESAFEFVGYRFERRDRWVAEATGAPQPIDEMGWREAPRQQAPLTLVPLPGEGVGFVADDRATVVVGPGCSHVGLEGEELVFTKPHEETRMPLRETLELVVLGTVGFAGHAVDALLREETRVILASDNGHIVGSLSCHDTTESPEAVSAQVDCVRDERWSLALARLLIAAKVRNYASLATALARDDTLEKDMGETARALADLEARTRACESIDSLRGVEGAAAARWYRSFGRRLPDWFRFPGRVAPDAADPGNVLLNIAMTALHRQVILAIRSAGLVSTLGILHAPRSGHATLASDLQEPFRHLMDRAVLHAARMLKPSDFKEEAGPDARHRLSIAPKAARMLTVAIYETFAMACAAEGGSDQFSYRTHLFATARAFRRHLVDRNKPFLPFRHSETDLPPAPVA